VVEIVTEDLRTGSTVGQTNWSGPGTLTLSALAGLLGESSDKSGQHKPDQDVELVHAQPHQHYPSNSLHNPNIKVLGRGCRRNTDCQRCLGAVCTYNRHCRRYDGSECSKYTCQCPRGYVGVTNQQDHQGLVRFSRSSLKYSQECVQL